MWLTGLCVLQVRAANMGRRGGPKIDFNILRQVEHADLINYGLIPEFVGRLPVIVSLQVGPDWGAVVKCSNMAPQCSRKRSVLVSHYNAAWKGTFCAPGCWWGGSCF